MLERFLLNAEKDLDVFGIFFYCILITIILSYINYFIGGNSIFLVSIISLALSYPVVNYIRSMTKKILNSQMNGLNLIKRHNNELIIFWTIFVTITIGLYFTSPLILDNSYQKLFVEKISGHFFNNQVLFYDIFINNLIVMFFTFIISLVTYSGFIFVLVWNASILAYIISKLDYGSLYTIYSSISYLSHGLFEIAGFSLAGIAGTLIAYRIDRLKRFNYKFNTNFYKDLIFLIFSSIFMILMGAIIEIL